MNDFHERLKAKIKTEREEIKENLAAGYLGSEYERYVGIIRGYDDVLAFCDGIMRDINNGK